MTQRIVFLMICAAALCAPHGRALAMDGGAAMLNPRPAAMVGPQRQFNVDLRLWRGDTLVTESTLDVLDGFVATATVTIIGNPGGRMHSLLCIVPPEAELTRADLEGLLDKNSARMFESAATTFCMGGVWFYLYSPGVDRCDVRITRRESWVTGRGLCTLGDEHSIGWLSTRVFEPGVVLRAQ